MSLSEVKTLYKSNARDIAAMLRDSANAIESEDQNDNPTTAIVAVQIAANGVVRVYGWGDTDSLRAIGTLHLGLMEVGRIELAIPVNRYE